MDRESAGAKILEILIQSHPEASLDAPLADLLLDELDRQEFLMSVEDEFGVEFTVEQVEAAHCARDLAAVICPEDPAPAHHYWVMVGEGKHPIQPIDEEPEFEGNWRNGEPIREEVPLLTYVLSADYEGKPKAMYYECAIPVMREDLVRALRSAGVENLETFPALLKDPVTGAEYRNYVAYNVVGLVSCVNRAGSTLMGTTPIQAGDTDFDGLVIDESKTQGKLLFRLAENVSAIVVHDSVKAAVEKAKIPGIVFYGPGEWSG